ncbi:MAG: ABC transporter permease [Cellvibrionaceae bacterium]
MSPIKLFSKHGELVLELARREVLDRYSGQAVGAIWALFHPIFLMGVYIIIFGFVFGLRFERDMPLDYGSYLLAGLIPWLAVVEVISKSSVVIAGNRPLIKQVVFPMEVLPVKGVVSTVFTQGVFWGGYIVYAVFQRREFDSFWLLLPLLMIIQTVFLMGLAFFISSIAAIIKDVKDLVQLVAVVGLYFLPIIYLPGMMPSWMAPLLEFNPLSHMVWVYQDVSFYGRIEHPISWIVWLVTASVVYVVGAATFSRLKNVVANYV